MTRGLAIKRGREEVEEVGEFGEPIKSRRPKMLKKRELSKAGRPTLAAVRSIDEINIAVDEYGREYNADTGRKLIRQYPEQECAVPGCKNKAIGEGDVCKAHGGTSLIASNLLAANEIPEVLQGRFDPAFHPMQYISLSKEGHSEVEIAAVFEISVGTLRAWSEKFLDFHLATEVGKAMYESWWLQQGKENLDNRTYNTVLFKFLTGNKLGWSDKVESKSMNFHAGVLLAPSRMNQDEWQAAAQEHQNANKAIDI